MRKLLLILVVILCFATSNAQNPFAEYGYTPKIATLSQGQYNEFFDNDILVQIGSVLFNTKSKQIVAFIETDTLYSEATLEPDIVSRWISPDPLAEKYLSISPYNYCMDNPVRFIDPNGMNVDEYQFNSDGQYTGKVKKEGEHYGTIQSKEGKETTKFGFADPINDPKSIDAGEITQVVEVSDKAIAKTLDESGVNKEQNQDNRAAFIINESNATNPKGTGKMDYLITAKVEINGQKQPIASNTLYITTTGSEKVAHNNYNLGNFLWGAGAKSLGIPLYTAKLGAHYNNYFYDPIHKGTLDSKDDQYSISLGYEWKK
jgi:hypothetical protein